MRFLFTTLQFAESDFYRRVSGRLAALGHEPSHVAFSRRAAAGLRDAGYPSWCLPEEMAKQTVPAVGAEAARIEAEYDTPSLRDVYITDAACRGKPEDWCVERTVRHFLALERAFDEADPDVVVPEVGSETMRTAAHLIAKRRGKTVLFLFYTIFPNPLRLYVDSYHAPIVDRDEVRELSDEERAEVEAFIAEFTGRGKPILAHRKATITPGKLRDFARHVAVRATQERDNEYLRPSGFVSGYVRQRVRRMASRPLYRSPHANRPFVYFPLHVTDDFKVKRVVPHCVDQEYLIRQVADYLPQGYDVVLKEHPVSIGKNPVAMLRRLSEIPNVRLVDPYTSSHELIRRSEAVAVISSTVGLEALLYGTPVLTMGQPFYSGYGVTVDVDSFRELREAVPRVLGFQPDRERTLQFLHAAMRSTYPGAPGGVDMSDRNTATLASSLDAAARRAVPEHAAA